MAVFENFIMYNLSMNSTEQLCFDGYERVQSGINNETNLSQLFSADDGKWGFNPPAFLRHDHIRSNQRAFSVLLMPGTNLYAIRLDPKLKCQFGEKSSPIRLFSEAFYDGVITDITLWNAAGDQIRDFSGTKNEQLKDYNVVTFKVDHAAALELQKNAFGKFLNTKQINGHDVERTKHGQIGGHAEEDRVFAIPFYFNLYDIESQVPIWVLNDHEIDGDAFKGFWHGKAHPNSNSFLIFE